MLFKSKKLMVFLAASALLTVGGVSSVSHHFKLQPTVSAAQVKPQTNYQIQSANYHQLKIVTNNATLWAHPYNPGVKAVGNVNNLARTNQLVHLNLQARTNGKIRYYQIGRVGRTLGWINANDLKQPKVFVLPYHYVSQFWPSHADDACEAAALMMALSVKGKGLHTPLHTVVAHIHRSKNPNYGYTHNPFKYGTGATIYPKALSKFTRDYFHIRAKDITGASKRSLISDIEHGNPVVFEGTYRMKNIHSDHMLALLGYKRGYFYYADPLSKRYGVKYNGWVSTKRFMQIFTSKVHGARAVLIY